MKITVFESKIEEVEKRLNAMAKKAAKCGCNVTFEIGEPHPQKIDVYAIDSVTRTQYVEATYTVSAVDVEISDDMIKRDGWTAVAKLEHFENGNLVTMFDRSAEVPEEWRTVAPHCDHCHVNRFRSVTYIVTREDGTTKQVGSGCLKEYTGIDPNLAALWASVQNFLSDNAADYCDVDDFDVKSSLVSVSRILAFAYDEIKKDGYRKVDAPHCTADAVLEDIEGNRKEASDEGRDTASAIIDWMNNTDFSGNGYVSSVVRDCVPLTKQGWAKRSHIARLAYIPVEWRKELERREKARERAAAHEAELGSGYIGEVGKRMNVKVHGGVCLSSWETMYGTTFLYKFYDENENVLVWYASGSVENVELVRELKATVKAHNEFNGVRQTVLTRCTVTERETKPEPEHPAYSGEADEAFEMFWEYCEA